jgi:GIY-YIG catalytic domain
MKPANKFIKTKWFPPYSKARKTNLAFLRGKAGVYLIRNTWDTIVYVGYSTSDLEKTITRHFQKWETKTQRRATYSQESDLTIRVVVTTPARAAILERALLVKYRPKDNPTIPKIYTVEENGKYQTGKWIEENDFVLGEYTKAGAVPVEDVPF